MVYTANDIINKITWSIFPIFQPCVMFGEVGGRSQICDGSWSEAILVYSVCPLSIDVLTRINHLPWWFLIVCCWTITWSGTGMAFSQARASWYNVQPLDFYVKWGGGRGTLRLPRCWWQYPQSIPCFRWRVM